MNHTNGMPFLHSIRHHIVWIFYIQTKCPPKFRIIKGSTFNNVSLIFTVKMIARMYPQAALLSNVIFHFYSTWKMWSTMSSPPVSVSLHFFTGEQNGPHTWPCASLLQQVPRMKSYNKTPCLSKTSSLRGETQCSNTVGQHKDLSNKPGVIMQCSAAEKHQGKQKLALMMTSDLWLTWGL